MSSNARLELQWYLVCAVFMLAAAWALLKNEHVRIDVVSSRLSQRTRLRIDPDLPPAVPDALRDADGLVVLVVPDNISLVVLPPLSL